MLFTLCDYTQRNIFFLVLHTDETEKLSDAMQQGTDSRSNPGPDTKMKSESISESEEKLNGMLAHHIINI